MRMNISDEFEYKRVPLKKLRTYHNEVFNSNRNDTFTKWKWIIVSCLIALWFRLGFLGLKHMFWKDFY